MIFTVNWPDEPPFSKEYRYCITFSVEHNGDFYAFDRNDLYEYKYTRYPMEEIGRLVFTQNIKTL